MKLFTIFALACAYGAMATAIPAPGDDDLATVEAAAPGCDRGYFRNCMRFCPAAGEPSFARNL